MRPAKMGIRRGAEQHLAGTPEAAPITDRMSGSFAFSGPRVLAAGYEARSVRVSGTLEGPCRPAPHRAAGGDAVLVSGPIGTHGMAIMAAREGLGFEAEIESDSAAHSTACQKARLSPSNRSIPTM